MNISKAAMNKSKCKKSLDYKNEYNNKIDTWRAAKKPCKHVVCEAFFVRIYTKNNINKTQTFLTTFTNIRLLYLIGKIKKGINIMNKNDQEFIIQKIRTQ